LQPESRAQAIAVSIVIGTSSATATRIEVREQRTPRCAPQGDAKKWL
jgi:hypothetical protein